MAKTQGLERSQTLGEQSMKKDEENANNNTGMAPYPAEIFQSLDADGNGHLDTREVSVRTLATNACKIRLYSAGRSLIQSTRVSGSKARHTRLEHFWNFSGGSLSGMG